jgi:hypothetical protein
MALMKVLASGHLAIRTRQGIKPPKKHPAITITNPIGSNRKYTMLN